MHFSSFLIQMFNIHRGGASSLIGVLNIRADLVLSPWKRLHDRSEEDFQLLERMRQFLVSDNDLSGSEFTLLLVWKIFLRSVLSSIIVLKRMIGFLV